MPELATFPRENGQRLVIASAEHQGRQFVSLRTFEGDTPVRSLGLRWSEAAALAEVLRKLTTPDPEPGATKEQQQGNTPPWQDPEQPQYVPPRHSRPEPRDMNHPLPPVQASPEPFSEFGD